MRKNEQRDRRRGLSLCFVVQIAYIAPSKGYSRPEFMIRDNGHPGGSDEKFRGFQRGEPVLEMRQWRISGRVR